MSNSLDVRMFFLTLARTSEKTNSDPNSFLFERPISFEEWPFQLENCSKGPHTWCRGRKGLPVLARKSQHMVVKAVALLAGLKDIDYMMVIVTVPEHVQEHFTNYQKLFFSVFLSSSSVFPSTWPWDIWNRGSIHRESSFSIISWSFTPKLRTWRPVQTGRPSAVWPFYRHAWGLECHDFSDHLLNPLLNMHRHCCPLQFFFTFPTRIATIMPSKTITCKLEMDTQQKRRDSFWTSLLPVWMLFFWRVRTRNTKRPYFIFSWMTPFEKNSLATKILPPVDVVVQIYVQ